MKSDAVSLDDFFYGTATLGERGQIVIPSDARRDSGIHQGDKILVFRHPIYPHMLILSKVGQMQDLLQQIAHALEQASKRTVDESAEDA